MSHPKSLEHNDVDGIYNPYSLNDLKGEFKLTYDGDVWGNAMTWLLVVATEIYWNRDGLDVPPEWEYRASPLGNSNDPDSYETAIVEAASDMPLLEFGKLLYRYVRLLKHLGKDY